MNDTRWQVSLGIALILFSILFYVIHFLFFRDPHHIFIFLVGDIAFVFIEVLLVTLIIHRVLGMRERRTRMEKLNMVIGLFFSEVGTKLIAYFSDFDPSLDAIKQEFIITEKWSDQDFDNLNTHLKACEFRVELSKTDVSRLRTFLDEKKDFLVRLLENPVLLEHESFTELLRSVFHLTEELTARDELTNLPDNDLRHIVGDIRRAYVILVHQWLDYMKYMKKSYPYLFSFAMRTNPFDQQATPIIK
jgi:hypothetical protein